MTANDPSSSMTPNERFMSQKLNPYERSLKKAVSTPSIVDKIKSEEIQKLPKVSLTCKQLIIITHLEKISMSASSFFQMVIFRLLSFKLPK